MSILTKVLKLFCYDPETDGANTFNIPKALNENWEKIDTAVAGKLSREDVAEEVKKAVEDGSLTAGDLGAVSEDMVGAPNGVAGLDENGQLPESQLPELRPVGQRGGGAAAAGSAHGKQKQPACRDRRAGRGVHQGADADSGNGRTVWPWR